MYEIGDLAFALVTEQTKSHEVHGCELTGELTAGRNGRRASSSESPAELTKYLLRVRYAVPASKRSQLQDPNWGGRRFRSSLDKSLHASTDAGNGDTGGVAQEAEYHPPAKFVKTDPQSATWINRQHRGTPQTGWYHIVLIPLSSEDGRQDFCPPN